MSIKCRRNTADFSSMVNRNDTPTYKRNQPEGEVSVSGSSSPDLSHSQLSSSPHLNEILRPSSEALTHSRQSVMEKFKNGESLTLGDGFMIVQIMVKTA